MPEHPKNVAPLRPLAHQGRKLRRSPVALQALSRSPYDDRMSGLLRAGTVSAENIDVFVRRHSTVIERFDHLIQDSGNVSWLVEVDARQLSLGPQEHRAAGTTVVRAKQIHSWAASQQEVELTVTCHGRPCPHERRRVYLGGLTHSSPPTGSVRTTGRSWIYATAWNSILRPRALVTFMIVAKLGLPSVDSAL